MIPQATKTVVVGTPLVLDCSNRSFNHAMSLMCVPGGGGTLTVESSNSANAITAPGSANWMDSGEGAMATKKEVVRYSPCMAIRITALVADGVVELKG